MTPNIHQKLHPGQGIIFFNQSRFRVLAAGRRWGKTHVCRMELVRAIKKPRQLVWYVAPTYGMAREIMWNELLDVIPRRWIKKINETRLTIKLKNNSEIQLKGADKPDTLRGRGVHFMVLDEFQDFKNEIWEKVLYPTLTSTRGRAIIIGTPKSYNHFYDLFVKGQNANNRRLKQWSSWQFPTIMSPFVPATEIINAKRNLDIKSFRQEFEASFESMSGRVYYPFDRNIHVSDDIVFNKNLPIWIGQDFNVNPMSTVIMQPQEDGELWVIDEIFMMDSSSEEVCNEIDRRYFRYKPSVQIYPDPAGGNRNSSRGESDLDVFRQAGYKRLLYKRKHPPVADRINAVNRMLMTTDGTVRLRINSKCKNLIDSLEQTIYKPGTREVDKSAGKEHMTDALGYPVEYRFPAKNIIIAGVSI